MDSSLVTVLILLGSIFLIIWLLVYINNRDAKRDANKGI